ncbi:MAG: HDOD domain-containing protein [Ignavibacteria bacterium]|nr:HDOD domain-containing protein [Ignavibacteria bacterium]
MRTPEQIKERVLTIIQLPALPTIAMEVIQMVDNPKTSASSLGKLISSDQALTAKVLKIANSPFYGFPKRISTIDFAIIVLGFDALREIVISISLVSSLQRKTDKYFDAKGFWDHSIATGVVARRLARDLGYRISGEVFVAGLLHDMGISILHRYFTNDFKRIVEIARETNLAFLEAEESVLQVTHGEVGGWLAERWNLPDHLTEAISLHHTPGLARRNKELVALIHCADVFCTRILEETVEFDRGIDFDAEALQALKLEDPEVLNRYLEDYKSAIRQDIDQVTSLSNTYSAARR